MTNALIINECSWLWKISNIAFTSVAWIIFALMIVESWASPMLVEDITILIIYLISNLSFIMLLMTWWASTRQQTGARRTSIAIYPPLMIPQELTRQLQSLSIALVFHDQYGKIARIEAMMNSKTLPV